jgi:prophage tail gpP-like protein
VLEALVRYARQRGVLVMPDGAGNILLTRAGADVAAVGLTQGENVLDMNGTLDWSQRFSLYVVKGQGGYREQDSDAAQEAHISGETSDAYVTRYRPLMLSNEADTNGATAKARATWEANTRIGKSAAASCTVRGWRQSPGGALWQPNLLVAVRAPWLRMDGHMLVREVTFNKGASGTTTQLALVSPQVYALQPMKVKKTKKGGGNPWMAVIPEEVRRGDGK